MLYLKVLGSIPPERYVVMFKIRFTTEGAGFSSAVKSMLHCSKSNLLNTWVQVQQTGACCEDLQDLQD